MNRDIKDFAFEQLRPLCEISEGVFNAIFDLWPHLVVDILNFDPFVMRVTDKDATVKLRRR